MAGGRDDPLWLTEAAGEAAVDFLRMRMLGPVFWVKNVA